MEYPSCATAQEAGNLGCRRVRVLASSRIRRVNANASGKTALCALCALLCVLAGPSARALASTATFKHIGGEQTFTVPDGVTSIEVVAAGAAGESFSAEEFGYRFISEDRGGKGAQVSGELSVTPGQTLYVEVGASESGEASDVRTSPSSFGLIPDDRLIVAGAGGSAASPIPFKDPYDEDEGLSTDGLMQVKANRSQRPSGYTGTWRCWGRRERERRRTKRQM